MTMHTDGDRLLITSGRGRGGTIAMCVIAVVIALLPLLPPAWRGVDTPTPVYLLGALLCLCAAFWWSVVTVDRAAGEVTVVRRWGPSRSVVRMPIADLEAVVLTADSDGAAEVYLRPKGADTGGSLNHSRAIVWGRSDDETRRLAVELAGFLSLRLVERGRG